MDMNYSPYLEYETTDSYSSVWIKYVRAVDLTVHCIDSLIGDRHRDVANKAKTQTIVLDEFEQPIAWYLCGVTYPYRWQDNAHLLAVPAPDEIHEYSTANLRLTLHNCKPLVIHPYAIDPSDNHAREYLFKTCRNWQAAWILHTEYAAPNMLNPEKQKWRKIAQAKKAKRLSEPDDWSLF